MGLPRSSQEQRRRGWFGPWRICTIGGTDVSVDASWLIVFVFVTWTTANSIIPARMFTEWMRTGTSVDVPSYGIWVGGVITSLLFFASILGHEAAHAVAAVRSGIPVRRIRLFIFGGVAEIESEPDRPSQEFFITVVGPLASATLGVLFIALANNLPVASMPRVTAQWLGEMNLILAVFNMLPGFPLDGGRILRSIVWAASGKFLRGTQVASFMGSVLGLALMVLGVAQVTVIEAARVQPFWTIFVGWFLWSAARDSYRDAQRRERVVGLQVRDILRAEAGAVPDDGSVQELVDRGLYQDGFGLRPVVSASGSLLGTLTNDDVDKVPMGQRAQTLIRDIACPVKASVVISADDSVEHVLAKAIRIRCGSFFVIENGRLIGRVDAGDWLKFSRT